MQTGQQIFYRQQMRFADHRVDIGDAGTLKGECPESGLLLTQDTRGVYWLVFPDEITASADAPGRTGGPYARTIDATGDHGDGTVRPPAALQH